MSKIGRKPIKLDGVTLDIQGQEINYKGPHASGMYVIPEELIIEVVDNQLFVKTKAKSRNVNRIWGLHRALLAGKIEGAAKLFERHIKITGLGYKAIAKGKQIEFSLGYSHKINFDLPEGVTVDIDRSGQNVTVKSADKQLVGQVCGEFRLLRPTEPYKGTGVRLTTDIVIRKAGKAKGA
ncbi:MAG: large subunit ribosomal protein L6 [Alteromonas naphthalenivorans]|jgi:large subunit ribosomal protein L6